MKSNGYKTKIRKLPKTIVYTGNSDLEAKITHYRYDKTSFKVLDIIDKPSLDYNPTFAVFKDKNRQKG